MVAQQLRREYGSGDNRVTALDGVSFEIAAGSRVALVGRSGSGKTTLVNLLAGLDRYDSGQLTVAGRELGKASRNQMAKFRCRKIGVIFQTFQLIATRTAIQNVELPMILAGVTRHERKSIAMEALRRVGLTERMSHLPGQLSGGEQQRVAIARAIVNRPTLLLADEPTGNLDSATAEVVMQLLVEVANDNQAALVLITHDRSLADRYTDRTMQLVDGSLVGEVPHELA